MICALALQVLVLLPLAASWRISGAGRVIGLLYVALAVGLGLYHTGIFSRGSLARTDIPIPIMAVGEDDPRCAQIIEALESAGVDINAPGTAANVEKMPGWQQVPEEARQLVLDCVRGAAGK